MSYTYSESVITAAKENENRRNTRILIIAIIIIVVIIAIALLIYFIVRARTPTTTPGDGNGNGSTPTTGCTSNAQCSGATPVCNTSTRTCVQCTSDATCPVSTPRCRANGNICVECLAASDCIPGEVCTNNQCVAGPCTTAVAPTLLSATMSDPNTISGSWTPVANATSYTFVYYHDPEGSAEVFTYTGIPGTSFSSSMFSPCLICAPAAARVFAVLPCGNSNSSAPMTVSNPTCC